MKGLSPNFGSWIHEEGGGGGGLGTVAAAAAVAVATGIPFSWFDMGAKWIGS
jgi:hypothetical protein